MVICYHSHRKLIQQLCNLLNLGNISLPTKRNRKKGWHPMLTEHLFHARGFTCIIPWAFITTRCIYSIYQKKMSLKNKVSEDVIVAMYVVDFTHTHNPSQVSLTENSRPLLHFLVPWKQKQHSCFRNINSIFYLSRFKLITGDTLMNKAPYELLL